MGRSFNTAIGLATTDEACYVKVEPPLDEAELERMVGLGVFTEGQVTQQEKLGRTLIRAVDEELPEFLVVDISVILRQIRTGGTIQSSTLPLPL